MSAEQRLPVDGLNAAEGLPRDPLALEPSMGLVHPQSLW